MAEMTLSALSRTEFGSSASRRIRRDGMVPGIVYGGSGDNIPVTVSPRDLTRLLRSHAGRNTILNLHIEGSGADSVILKDWQVDPVSEAILHADFQRIAMDKPLRVTVPIVMRGTAQGVKTEGGLLEVVMRDVEVECLPSDIPDSIECDVTELELHQSIRVEGLPALDNVRVLADPDQVVVHVMALRAEAEEEAAAEGEAEVEAAPEGEGAEPEVMARGKKEEDEGGD